MCPGFMKEIASKDPTVRFLPLILASVCVFFLLMVAFVRQVYKYHREDVRNKVAIAQEQWVYVGETAVDVWLTSQAVCVCVCVVAVCCVRVCGLRSRCVGVWAVAALCVVVRWWSLCIFSVGDRCALPEHVPPSPSLSLCPCRARAQQWLTGYVCHELRNPLHILKANVQDILTAWTQSVEEAVASRLQGPSKASQPSPRPDPDADSTCSAAICGSGAAQATRRVEAAAPTLPPTGVCPSCLASMQASVRVSLQLVCGTLKLVLFLLAVCSLYPQRQLVCLVRCGLRFMRACRRLRGRGG